MNIHPEDASMPRPAQPVIEGIVPVMLTPFDETGHIDFPGVDRLIEWYLALGCDALFAVAQSSEMQWLSLDERTQLARHVVERVAGRVPVAVSGHISDCLDTQVHELNAMAASGADAVVLVTNHLDPQRQGSKVFLDNLHTLLERLPVDVPLGLYECPAPYRRLLSDEELQACIDSQRFIMLKDVSCDLQVGAAGFSGVFTNFHPDLYQWLRLHGAQHPPLAQELATFLVLAATTEGMGYPALAKIYHQRIGTFASIRCRVIDYDVRERHWALDAVLDKIVAGTEHFRARIRALDTLQATLPGKPRHGG